MPITGWTTPGVARGVTRRQFLKLMGATVGSAAVMNTMSAWGLLEASAQETPPVLQGGGNGKSVIVLGAGPGGCVAAYELMQAGYDVTILEAQSHIGGHALTVRRGTTTHEFGGEEQVCDFDEGLWFDAGPSRIPFSHRGILHYCDVFNIPLTDYNNINDNAWVYAENIAGGLNGKAIRLNTLISNMAGYTSELLAKSTSQEALDQQLTVEDRDLLLSYLMNWGMLSPEDLSFRGSDRGGFQEFPGVGTPGETATPIPLQDLLPFAQSILDLQAGYLTSVPEYDWQATMMHPVNGVGQIFEEGFGPTFGDRIKLNSPVQEIRQDENQVRIVYQDGETGQQAEITGDFCVCNIPLSVLIKIPADFSSEFADALLRVPYAMSMRMGLAFKRRFWEEDDQIYGGQSFFNVPEIGIMHYPDFDYHAQTGVLLGMYNFGDVAANISILSPRDRAEVALEYGSKIHPTFREDFQSAFSVAWHRMPFQLGAWPSYYPASRAQYYPRLLEPDGRVYLVGEHLSFVNAWIEGAVQGAWYQLERLHQRAMQS